MICTKRNHNKELEWVCLNSSCPHKGLMCPQCLMETFQLHKHDAPDIMGYKVFLDAADTCLKESEEQLTGNQSKSLESLQQIIDENNSKLLLTRDKVIEIVQSAFAALQHELQSVESTIRVKSDSERGPVSRLKELVQKLMTKPSDRSQAESDIAYVSNYLLKGHKENTFKLHFDKIYKNFPRKIGEKDIKLLKDKCDEVKKNISLINKWALKLKKATAEDGAINLEAELKGLGSPSRAQASAAKKSGKKSEISEPGIASSTNPDKLFGDGVRKQQQFESIGMPAADRKSLEITKKASSGNKPLSPPKKENPFIEKLGPFSFLDDHLPQKPTIQKAVVQKKEIPSVKSTISSSSQNYKTPISSQQQLPEIKSVYNGFEYFTVRRFENDKSSQVIGYLESHAISFVTMKEVNLIGFSNYTLTDDHPADFVGHLDYALIEGDGIDDDDELDLKVVIMRTNMFDIRRDIKKRLAHIFFEKAVKIEKNKIYTLKITNNSKAKICCWEGSNGRSISGPFKFLKSRDTNFHKLSTNVKTGQIPELLYTN